MFRVHILVRFFAVSPQKMRPIFLKKVSSCEIAALPCRCIDSIQGALYTYFVYFKGSEVKILRYPVTVIGKIRCERPLGG
jgi:hypothetical protein